MPNATRPWLLSSLATMAVAALPAQATPAETFRQLREQLTATVQAQLRSTDPATIAWGAHAAAEFRLSDCIPDLRRQLSARAEPGDPQPYTALALLDALIQTHAELQGAELRPFVSGLTRCSAFLLLSPKVPEHLPPLLELYRRCRHGSSTFLLCGQALADARAPGFALELLREPLWVVMTVLDPGAPGKDERNGLGMVSGCVRLTPPPGFPPSIQYGLTRASRFATKWDGDAAADLCSEEQLTARTRWLQQLLGDHAAEVPFDLMPLHNVEWAGLDALRAREQEERTKLQAMHKALVAQCVKQKLITVAEGKELAPTLRVFWIDCREDQTPRIHDYEGH